MAELEQSILSYVKDYHSKNKRAPSLRALIRQFKGEGLNFAKFYQLFPRGITEACSKAGVPTPMERIRQTEMAIQGVKMKEGDIQENVPLQNRLILTEAQTKRLLGMSHLEGGKDPLIIVDELMNRDSELRREFKLSFKDTSTVSGFLNMAVGRGWSVSTSPNIVDFCTQLWNLGIQQLPPETVSGLIQILNALKASKWDPTQFVREATDAKNSVYWFTEYKAGRISANDFKRMVGGLA
jgi:hypothetical protein